MPYLINHLNDPKNRTILFGARKIRGKKNKKIKTNITVYLVSQTLAFAANAT